MAQFHFTLKSPKKHVKPALLKGEPDFTRYPWPGLIRALYFSYFLDLPHLRWFILEAIERKAIDDWEARR